MKYLSRNELSELINNLKTQRDKIRSANSKLKNDLAVLDSPSSRVYTEGERLIMKSELRQKALGSFANSFATENKVIGRQKSFWTEEFFDAVPLHEQPNIAAESMEKLWLSRKYELMGAGQFAESVMNASSEGRAAELGVARLVHGSRNWNPEQRGAVGLALMQAERDVVYPDRQASLELLEVASDLLEDAESSLSALRSGNDDIRLKAQPYIEQRLKKESAQN